MIAEIIKQWEKNKHKLREYFKSTKQSEYDTYGSIVEKIFEICLIETIKYNPNTLKNVTTIDHGEYDGIQIFIIPTEEISPSIDDYLITHTYYAR